MIFAATGRSAFGADTVPAVMHRIVYGEPDISGVPPSLVPAIQDCLQKDPQRRPSARDLLLRLVDPSVPFPAIARTAPAGLVDEAAPTGPLGAEPLRTEPRRPDPRYAGALPADSVPALAGSGFVPDGSTRPSAPPPRSARPRRGLVVAAGGGAVVAALIVAGVLLLTRGPASRGSASTVTTSNLGRSSSAPATVAPTTTVVAPGVTIPPAFAGTWTGTATISVIGVPGVGLTNPITFMFVAGAKTISENNQSCVNTLTLTGKTATVLTFNEPQTLQCVAGTVTFTLRSTGLAYRWVGGGEQNVALLHKT